MATPHPQAHPSPARSHSGAASSRSAGAGVGPAPGLSTDRPRQASPGRAEPHAPVRAAVASQGTATTRASMMAHVEAAARVARVHPRATRTLESGEVEIVYDARWGLLRGRPCVTWDESRRELSVSVKQLGRETLVHTFPVRSPEHYGVIAQTAMSLVVGRAR